MCADNPFDAIVDLNGQFIAPTKRHRWAGHSLPGLDMCGTLLSYFEVEGDPTLEFMPGMTINRIDTNNNT